MQYFQKARRRCARLGLWLPLLALWLSTLPIGLVGCGPKLSAQSSVASVEVVRTSVDVDGSSGHHSVLGEERVMAGQTLAVAERAQALLHHDVGARLPRHGSRVPLPLRARRSGRRRARVRTWAVGARGGGDRDVAKVRSAGAYTPR